MTKETWYVLDTGHLDAATNMAIDEALLHFHSKKAIPPTIRFYGWERPSLTVGHFQNVEKTINFAGIKKHRCDFVRRLTGGNAVLHDNELTYSIIVSEAHPKIPQSINEAYFVLGQGILQGYLHLGIHAEFALPDFKQRDRSAVCFETPAIYELIVDGKKVTGNAQTRKQGVLLQHGSIPLKFDVDMLFDLFAFSSEQVRERQKAKFLQRAIAINDITGKTHTFTEVKEAFRAGFEVGLNIRTEPYELTPEQWNYIEVLAETKYRTKEWNFYRKTATRSGS